MNHDAETHRDALASLGITRACAAALESTIERVTGPLSAVVLLLGPAVTTLNAAHLVAARANPDGVYLVGTHTADRWTRGELDEALAALAVRYEYRISLTLTDVDLMDAGTADHLLMPLEQPNSPALFILTAASSEKIPTTILSRCNAQLHLDPLGVAVWADKLPAAGLSTQECDAVIGVGQPLLAQLVVTGQDTQRDHIVTCCMQMYGAGRRDVASLTADVIAQVASSIEALATLVATGVAGDTANAAATKPATAAVLKAATRTLSRQWLTTLSDGITHAVRTATTSEHLKAAINAQERVQLAQLLLDRYVAPATALHALNPGCGD